VRKKKKEAQVLTSNSTVSFGVGLLHLHFGGTKVYFDMFENSLIELILHQN